MHDKIVLDNFPLLIIPLIFKSSITQLVGGGSQL